MPTPKKSKQLELLDETFTEGDYNDVPPGDIIAYNELRSCADLHRMYKEEILDINPDFQRDEIWPDAQKTRFIDSLIKKLPIPSMCFSLDYKTEKWQVVDGLQRISSIIKFFDDKTDWKLSKLKDIDSRLSDNLVSKVKQIESGILFNRLANLTIPITVIRCDYSKKEHTNYLFTIFHRLNTGGIKLTNQEIRNAIYNGRFNSFLKDCNSNDQWRKLLGLEPNKTYRLSKEELILRFFAFYDKRSTYVGTLSKFLNEYMAENRHPSNTWLDSKKDLFNKTVDIIFSKVSEKKILSKNSNVIVESVLYGVGKNLQSLSDKPPRIVKSYFTKLISDTNFSEENLREGLASKQKVNSRLQTSEKIFRGN